MSTHTERFEVTTRLIEVAAAEELLHSGYQGFSLTGVATRAHVAIGSVYLRWPTREDCLITVSERELPPLVGAIAQSVPGPDDARLASGRWLLPGLRAQLELLASAVLEARLHQALATVVAECLPMLAADHARRRDRAGCLVGTGMALRLGLIPFAMHRGGRGPAPADRPGSSGDDIARRLMVAACARARAQGTDGLHARKVAEDAGVTTGALYRRFPGIDDLCAAAAAHALADGDWDTVLDLAGDAHRRPAVASSIGHGLAAAIAEVGGDAGWIEVLTPLGCRALARMAVAR